MSKTAYRDVKKCLTFAAEEAEASFAPLFQLALEYDSEPAGGVDFGTCLKMAFVQFTLYKPGEIDEDDQLIFYTKQMNMPDCAWYIQAKCREEKKRCKTRSIS